MFTKYITLAAAFAILAVAQDNNDSTTSSNPRIVVASSTATGVYTPVETTTNVEFSTTSLPHSLDTVTAVSTNLITQTSLNTNVYTTNTLSDGNTDTKSLATVTSVVPTNTPAAASGAGNVLKAGSDVLGAAFLGAAALI